MLHTQLAAASAPVFGTASQTRFARQLTPPKGKALVYIYQLKSGGGVSPKIWLNNYEIGRIVPGSFTVWQLAPGRLELRVDGVEPARVSLISQAGKVYLFRLSVSRAATGARAEIDSLPQAYRSELADTRFIKNPRQVTAPELAAAPAPPANQVSPEPTVTTTEPAKPRPQPRYEEALRPGGMTLLFKTGTLSLSNQTQSILGSDRQFDKNASGIYAVEFDYQFRDSSAVGGEILGYKTSYTTVGSSGTGDVSVVALLANAKQYYRSYSRLQPYLGIGAGVAATQVSGVISGNTSGFAYQLLAGLEYRNARMGAFAEAKYLGVDTKSSNGQKINASGTGIFAGVAFHF